MSTRLVEAWYRGHPALVLLWPLAALFWFLSGLRRILYRTGLLKSTRLPVPVIVVGNITVGGSGKTPLVLWLSEFLQAEGYRPGIVSRGYGGRAARYPCHVRRESSAGEVGDEPLLLALRSGVPVVVDPLRARGAQALVAEQGCDIVLSDDGLQHYALARALEIVVVDGERRYGNGWLLPAGPLRESRHRLTSVDFVVCNGEPQAGEHGMRLVAQSVRSCSGTGERPLSDFAGQRVHAVAGIGNPGRFFRQLRAAGVQVVEHPFPDHHAYVPGDLHYADAQPVLMTEKDYVKCRDMNLTEAWYVPVSAEFDPAFARALRERLSHKLEKPHG